MRGRRTPPPATPPSDEPVEIVLTIELSNGHFRTVLRAPLVAAAADKERFVGRWLDLIATCLKTGVHTMDASWPEQETP